MCLLAKNMKGKNLSLRRGGFIYYVIPHMQALDHRIHNKVEDKIKYCALLYMGS